MKKKQIIISFDYELFFGDRAGSVENSIIKPTNKLLDCLDSIGEKGNFFVDFLMFKFLEQETEERAKNDLKLLKDQIRNIVERGHRIELHIHPHWLDAKYKGNGIWDFKDFSHYMISTLPEDVIYSLFKEGVEYLNNLAREVDSSYSMCAFRAGGWAVQPFFVIKGALYNNQLLIDSSSAYGRCCKNVEQYYDFTNMPSKDKYRFSDDVCIEDNRGDFLEIPITTYKCSLINILLQGISARTHMADRLTDGTHNRNFESSSKPNTTLKNRFGRSYQMFTFSQTNPINIIISNLQNKRELCCYIDHPKDFSKMTLLNIKLACLFGSTITYKELEG